MTRDGQSGLYSATVFVAFVKKNRPARIEIFNCTDGHHGHDHKVEKLDVDGNLLLITKVKNNGGAVLVFGSLFLLKIRKTTCVVVQSCNLRFK